jgi:hypothetical protein
LYQNNDDAGRAGEPAIGIALAGAARIGEGRAIWPGGDPLTLFL